MPPGIDFSFCFLLLTMQMLFSITDEALLSQPCDTVRLVHLIACLATCRKHFNGASKVRFIAVLFKVEFTGDMLMS